MKHFFILTFLLLTPNTFAKVTDEQLIENPPDWDGTTTRSEESSRYLAIMTVLNHLISHNHGDNAVNISQKQVEYAQKAKTFSMSVSLYKEWSKNGKQLPEKIKTSIRSYSSKKTKDGKPWPLYGDAMVSVWEEGHGYQNENYSFDITALVVLTDPTAEHYGELFNAHDSETNPWLPESVKVDSPVLIHPKEVLKKIVELGKGKDLVSVVGFEPNLDFPTTSVKKTGKKVVVLGQAGAESYVLTQTKDAATVDTEINANLSLSPALVKKYAAQKGEALDDVRTQLCGAYRVKGQSEGWLKEKSKRERVGNFETVQVVKKSDVERNVAFAQDADKRIQTWESSYKSLTGQKFKYTQKECPDEE